MTTTEQDINIGDRVLCKFHGVLAIVDHFGIHEGKKTYIVKYDEQRVRADGSRYQFEEYFRYALTKNYDENGREIDGNAAYYREELLADFWGDDKTPRVFQFGSSKITAYPPTTGSKFPQSWHVFEKKGEKEKVDETYRSLENLADYLVLLYNEQGTENKSLVLTDYEDYFCDDNHSESESMNGFQLGEVVYDQLGEIGIIGAFYGKGEVRLDSNGVTDIDNIRKCPVDIAAEAISHKQKIRNKTHKVQTAKITEDYVSFEVAKLLKEKGFDEYCGTAYTTADGKPIRVMGSTYPLEHNGGYDKHHYSMPSQSVAMKWLRELYNIHILIDFANDCKSYWPRLYVYHDDRNIEAGSYYSKWEEVSEFGYYDTHEEAVEDALKYVLENFETLAKHLFTNN